MNGKERVRGQARSTPPVLLTPDTKITTWYRTVKHNFLVDPVFVAQESKKSLWVLDTDGATSKQAKFGHYRYWPTRDAAVEHLKERVEWLRSKLAYAEEGFRRL